MSLFTPRATFKPFLYPEAARFKTAIYESFWTVKHWTFDADVQDYRCKLDDKERSVIKRALLAISQVEVSVKRFWGKLGDRLPHPELEQVGATFASNEVIHADAYSHLLDLLDLNGEYALVTQVPAMRGRINYLAKAMSGAKGGNRDFAHTLALFSLFVENCSLFSQFLIIKSFNKHRNVLKDIDNAVQSTAIEEGVHAQFGAFLVDLIRRENPSWFGPDFEVEVHLAAQAAYEAELAIIDWIFEGGEPAFLRKEVVAAFLADRFNKSLAMLGLPPLLRVDAKLVGEAHWFEEEVHAPLHIDFFNKRSNGYTVNAQPITAESIF